MRYSFGDVLLVPFPFTDQSTIKKRPAVVISSNQYNQQHRDAILMAITSQTRSTVYPDNFLIQAWQQAGLLKPSVVKPIITTVQSSLILRQLGTLASADQKQLKDLVGNIVG